MHSDGVQAAGKIPVNVARAGRRSVFARAATNSTRPRASARCSCAREPRFVPMIHGGHHERDRRAGTENVPGAVGLGRAAQWIVEEGPHESGTRGQRCAIAWSRVLLDRVPGSHVNGAGAPRTPNTTNMRFDGIDSEALLIALDLRGFRGFQRLGLFERRDRAVACAHRHRSHKRAGPIEPALFARPLEFRRAGGRADRRCRRVRRASAQSWRLPMPDPTIAVAMSGGVDSSVVAGMLQSRGETRGRARPCSSGISAACRSWCPTGRHRPLLFARRRV